MKRRDQESDPTSRSKAPSSVEPPRAAFDPPIENPAVVALLKGLKQSSTPEPMQVSVTDGEMSANYVGGPRPLPLAHEGHDSPGPNIVVDPNAQEANKKDPAKLDTTFRIRPRQRTLALPLAAAVVVLGCGIAAWIGRGQDPAAAPRQAQAQPPRAANTAPLPLPTTVPPPPDPVAVSPSVSPPRTSSGATARGAAPSSSSSSPEPRKRSDIDPGSSPF